MFIKKRMQVMSNILRRYAMDLIKYRLTIQKKHKRQRNSQEKRDKKTNNDLQTIHRKLKIGQREPH
jgi:uncharacterized protein YaiI (UPF0178 family)